MATTTRDARIAQHDGLFSQRIRKLRLQQGLQQKEVCRLAGIPTRTYRGWEHGESVPRPGPPLRKLANAFRVSPLFLLFGEEED